MRLALLSDIHGNLVALEATLADLAARGGADLIVCVGDLCLDGPQPAAVLDLVRAGGWPTVMGNTDRYLSSMGEAEARASDKDWPLLEWTRGQLGEERVAWLGALPFSQIIAAPSGAPAEAILVVHANPRDLEGKLWPETPVEELRELLGGVEQRLVAHGHIHIPSVRAVDRWTVVNVASVGQPKDGDPRAAYSLLTWGDEGWAIEQHRVAYDLDREAALIRDSGLPGAEGQIATLRQARYADR